MKYERIERTLEETIEFFNKIKWSINKPEKDLLLNHDIKAYKKYYSQFHEDIMSTAQSIIDFFFKQVEEFEEGQWCWFYDNDEFSRGTLARYNYYLDKNNSYICKEMIYDCKVIWNNCISIEKFRERLKEYL